MSANVKEFVVHQITLEESGKLSLSPRNSSYTVSSAVIELASQLHSQFNQKPSKGIGGFVASDTEGFKAILDAYLENDISFYQFSINASEALLSAIVNESMLETGYVIFSHYDYLATEYLLISMLNTKELVSLTRDLELSQSTYIEPSKMQLAVRLDLSQYQSAQQDQRYISFIKGRMGRKVSDFFMSFVGCEEQVDIKAQNKQLVHQVNEYLSAQPLDGDEKQKYRKSVSDYYKDKVATGDDISLNELDEVLPQHEQLQGGFSHYASNSAQSLEPRFQADKSVLSSMNKYSGAGGGVHISFDRKLLGEKIMYDPSSDTLTIYGIPPNLKDQLTSNKQAEQDSDEG